MIYHLTTHNLYPWLVCGIKAQYLNISASLLSQCKCNYVLPGMPPPLYCLVWLKGMMLLKPVLVWPGYMPRVLSYPPIWPPLHKCSLLSQRGGENWLTWVQGVVVHRVERRRCSSRARHRGHRRTSGGRNLEISRLKGRKQKKVDCISIQSPFVLFVMVVC